MRLSARRPRICFWVRLTVRVSALPRLRLSSWMKNHATCLLASMSSDTTFIGTAPITDGSIVTAVWTYGSPAK